MSNGLNKAVAQRSKSELVEFLDNYIRSNNINLAELQRRLMAKGLQRKDNYVYRVASGEIERPPDEFFSALHEVTGAPVADLVMMVRKRATLPPRFRFAFGHCLWAAPIPLAFEMAFEARQEILDFEVASYLEAGDLKFWNRKSEAPPDIQQSISAADVLERLLRNEIHVGAVPGMILGNGYGSAICSLGTIVDSFSGCTFVCPRAFLNKQPPDIAQMNRSRKGISDRIREETLGSIRKETQSASGRISSSDQSHLEDHELPMETCALGRWLVESSREQEKPVRVGVEPRTIAEHFLAIALKDGGYHPALQGEMAWAVPNRRFASDSFDDLAVECSKRDGSELAGLLTWEPHGTLVVKNSKNTAEKNDLVKVPLLLSPEIIGRPRHLTFDIVVNAERLSLMDEAPRRDFRGALRCLMSAFRSAGNRLNNIHREEEDLDALDRIGRYFGLSRTEALAAVGQIRYSVAIDPWW